MGQTSERPAGKQQNHPKGDCRGGHDQPAVFSGPETRRHAGRLAWPNERAVLAFSLRMTTTRQRPFATLVAAAWLAASCGACAPPQEGPARDEPLVTEDVGGAIDHELSTAEDPRGPRWVESGSVLPAGFPADLPLVAGCAVAEAGATGDGGNFVVFESAASPAQLAADWQALLRDGGWQASSAGESRMTASKLDLTVSAEIVASGSGSRLRIVYP